ncbi:hypothetical protein BBOR36S_05116 [Brevibacillus borstelensis]
MMQILKKPIFKYVLTTLFFISVLLSLRSLWSEVFRTAEHPDAVQGVLDMRGWPFEESPTIALNGEWEFYPGELVSHEDIARMSTKRPHFIQVPGLAKRFPGRFGIVVWLRDLPAPHPDR